MGTCSSVTFGNALNLVLLANGVRALSGGLGGVDDLVGEGLGDTLEGTESGVLRALVHQVERLVNAAEGRDINGLTTHNTTGTNTGGVLTGTSVGTGINKDLDRVLASEQVDELKGLLNDAEGVLLLTVGAVTGNHNGADEALNEGALDLLELALLVATGGEGNKDLLLNSLDVDVVRKGGFGADNAFVAPSAEKLGLNGELGVGLIVIVLVGLDVFDHVCHVVFKG